MKKIYFTRHGQTVWNVENKICGVTDIELTAKGHEQAKELGKLIAERCYGIDEILCSPLVRAADTARHISTAANIPLREEPRLKEQCFGKFEGTARNGEEFLKAKGHFLDSYEGGESMMKLAQRIYNLLDELKEDDKTYLLVAHNGISRVIKSYFCDMDNEEYARFGIDNCEVLEFEFT
ncbi:MAG: histidine phosphatase family protein [Clostridia bacterium]|nr:histidine phosphatase family protein [Clostridia bacterium]